MKINFFKQLSEKLNITGKEKILAHVRSVVHNVFYTKNQENNTQMEHLAGEGHRNEKTSTRRNSKKSFSQDYFTKEVFGEFESKTKNQAIKGLFRFIYDYHKDTDPSFRFHWFFKNIEGLWACADPKCTEHQDDKRSIGRIYLKNPPLLCEKQHRVFETLYCEQCGTLFLGGMRLEKQNHFEILQTSPDIEKIPDEHISPFVEKRSYKDYALFWPCPNEQSINTEVKDKKWKQASLTEGKVTNNAKWEMSTLNKISGEVKLEHSESENTVKGYLLSINGDTDKQFNTIMALASICPSCGADHSKKKSGYKTPIRGFRTGFSKMIQILSKELFYQLDEQNKKLIVFSDSREEAARTSNGIERNHYHDLIREMIYSELKLTAEGLPALLLDIEQGHNEATNEMAKKYDKKHPGSFNKLKDNIQVIKNYENQEDPAEELKQKANEYQKKLKEIKQMEKTKIVPIKILFEEGTDQVLLFRLKNKGVNPAGNRKDIIYDYKNKPHLWSNLFHFPEKDQKDNIWCKEVNQVFRIEKRRLYKTN